MNEIYISTDVEADGPIPGPHSMLSIGSAAYTADKVLVSTFSANLETMPAAQAHPKTAEWWAKHPEAWAACRKDLEPPEHAMTRYVTWIESLNGKPVFVAYPAGFDFMFVYWYLMKFVGESPFSHSALDIKSFAMALLKTDYRASTKRNMPMPLSKVLYSATCLARVARSDRSKQDCYSCSIQDRGAHRSAESNQGACCGRFRPRNHGTACDIHRRKQFAARDVGRDR